MIKGTAGRPRIINPLGEKFLAHYLDPLSTPDSICQAFQISRRTYNKYENELNLPTVKVGIGNNFSHLPRKMALSSSLTAPEKYDLDVLRQLAFQCRIKIHLVPYSILTNAALAAVRNQSVDFAISSISYTQERARDLYFSQSYFRDETPYGCLISHKDKILLNGLEKPLLGVPDPTVHSEYAFRSLQDRFQVHTYRSITGVVNALNSKRISYGLFHPNYFDYMPEETKNLTVQSGSISYKSHTGLIFHRNSEFWRQPINKALDVILEKNLVIVPVREKANLR